MRDSRANTLDAGARTSRNYFVTVAARQFCIPSAGGRQQAAMAAVAVTTQRQQSDTSTRLPLYFVILWFVKCMSYGILNVIRAYTILTRSFVALSELQSTRY